MTYEDHFSGHSEAYARHRPRYPRELFSWLASIAPARGKAWDAGTGNGQVAVALAEHFEQVVATDASADQIQRAEPHARVEYRVEPADLISLGDATVDLVTAGAAVHWFALDRFYREVRRVGKKDAIVALFSYGTRDFADAAGAVGTVMHRFQEEIVGDFWPERIQYVHDRYATLPFPFEDIEAPTFVMTAHWNLRDLLAFLDTWSASQRYFRQHGTRAVDAVEAELAEIWGDPDEVREFRCPLFMRLARL